MSVRFLSLGNSAMRLSMPQSVSVLIDPSFEELSGTEVPSKAVSADFILLTHGTPALLRSTLEIAGRAGATVIANSVLTDYLRRTLPGNRVVSLNIGGQLSFEWGEVTMTPAAQVSLLPDGTFGGPPAGFVIRTQGHKIYHSGNSGLSSEMRFIGDYYKPNVSMLAVDPRYALRVEDLSRTVMWLGSDIILPMLPEGLVDFDPDEIYHAIDHDTSAICKMLQPGTEWELAPAEASGRKAGPEAGY